MFEAIYTPIVVVHVIASMIAVGTVTVTDYLHILGIKNRDLERSSLPLFPRLSKLISGSLAVIWLTGILMVITRPELLTQQLFLMKVFLVIIVTINGFVLHHFIFPKVEKVTKNNYIPEKLKRIMAFSGSISIVSWYAIVVIAITRSYEYSIILVILLYLLAIFTAYGIAIAVEHNRQ